METIDETLPKSNPFSLIGVPEASYKINLDGSKVDLADMLVYKESSGQLSFYSINRLKPQFNISGDASSSISTQATQNALSSVYDVD